MKEISIDIKREIVQAVFLMRPDTFFLLIQKHGMPESLMKDVGCFSIPIPIYYLYDGDMKDVPSDPQDKEDFLFDHALQAWWRIEIHASGVGVDCKKIVINNESCDNWRNYTHLLDWTAHDMMQKLFLKYMD